MSSTVPSTKARRADVEQIYDHLASVFASVDLSEADPSQYWVTSLRHVMKRYGGIGSPPPLDDVTFTPVSADGVAAEWVVADGGSSKRRIVYVHGGGWVAGDPQAYRPLTATLARFSGASVLAVDYRLAPEHPFPAGLEDTLNALAWAGRHGPDGETPAEAVSLVGDSAGGNLAAAACLLAIGSGHRVPDRLVIIAGTLDNIPDPGKIGRDDPICTPDNFAAANAAYLGSRVGPSDPRVSPVYASTEVLAKFPPTLIQASSVETLLADARQFAQRLEAADVRVCLSVWPDLPHVWHVFVAHLPEATAALQEIASFIRT
jgi:epsilon-lactone hydrolase